MSIQRIKTLYEGQLMRLPNVTGVSIGEKAGKEVIKVFVTQKAPKSSLRPEEVVPEILEGYKTEVVETGFLNAQTR